MMLAAPILYMAIGKPYGMRPEVYIYYYLLPSLLSNKDRPYETKLTYDSILEEIEKQEQLTETNKNHRKEKKNEKTKPKQKTKNKAKSKQDILYL